MTKGLIILEDVSKTTFGGGQSVTSSIIDIVSDIFEDKMLFQLGFSKKLSDIAKLKGYDIYSFKSHISKYKIFESLMFFLFYLPMAILSAKIKINKVRSNDIVIYSTTKKTLILSFVLKVILNKKVSAIHHCHQVEKRGLIYDFVLSKINKVIFVSKISKSNYSYENSIVIYNTYGTLGDEIFEMDKKKSELDIAYIGQLTEMKGVLDFIDLATKFHKKANFNIYGKGPLEKSKTFITALEKGIFTYHGFIDDVKKEIFQNIDLVVYPSYHIEAFPLVVIETLSTSTPIFTTNLGGHVELFDSSMNDFLVPAGNLSILEEKLNSFILDKKKWDNIASYSSHQISICSFDNFKKEIVYLFQG